MNNSIVVVVLASAVAYGTPLLYAALGELLAERSGVLNLGVEGMMLVGAVMGFLAVQRRRWSGRRRASRRDRRRRARRRAAALILAFLVITLRANQIVSGLALTIFAGAAGLSSYLGNDFNLADDPAPVLVRGGQRLRPRRPAGRRPGPVRADVARLRLVGLRRRRRLLPLAHAARPERARGRRVAGAADAMGISVTKYRYLHTIAGGAFAGVGGACFSLAMTPRGSTASPPGAGWIAIALVIFAFWRADLCLVGAYVFGAFSALPFTLQARGMTIAPQFFQALPYVMTIVVLVDRLLRPRPAPARRARQSRRPVRARGALTGGALGEKGPARSTVPPRDADGCPDSP